MQWQMSHQETSLLLPVGFASSKGNLPCVDPCDKLQRLGVFSWSSQIGL